MKLADYLSADKELTLEALGERAGLSAATLSRLSRGLHKPNWDTMEKIERATDGQVRCPHDWADSPEEPMAEAS